MTNLDFLYDKNHYEDNLRQNHFYDKKLHFRIIENGTILPYKPPIASWWGFGGVIDEKRNFLNSSFVHSSGSRAYTPTEEVKISSQSVVYLGMLVGVWGHSITDNLKFLWFLKSEEYKTFFKNCPIVYLPWKDYIGGGWNSFKLGKVVANFGSGSRKINSDNNAYKI